MKIVKTYIQFVNEENENRITVQDIYNTLKQIFVEDDVLSTDSVYESFDGGIRLVISISKLYTKDEVVIFTKFLFNVDNNKTYLTSNTFKYLYEINCQFEEESFTDTNDLTTKITDIITQNKFGENLKKLSDFIKKPEHDINEWFYKNKIKDISVTGFKFDPEMKNIPCKNLTFTFTMTVNEQDDVELIIKKLSVGRFKFTFKIFDKSFDIDKPSLTTLIETIGETLKDKYQK